MSNKTITVGLLIAAAFPLTFAVLAGLSSLIPGCVPGGSGGPAYGCLVFGISLNWLINFVTLTFVISFFSVPIGILICLVGAFLPNKSS